jgi:ribosome-interacting GTPase 1
MGLEEEIDAIEEEIRETPYNKSTEAHIGRLKAKLAEKKEQLETQQSGSGGGTGYAVQKTGDATVALVGFPSVGKSTLLNALTNAESEVGEYEFTTLEVNPGMLDYRGANIQLLDVPGLIEGAAGGRGRGREVLSVVRASDLVLFVVDPFDPERYARLSAELYANNVRVDAEPPKVSITRTGQGGIRVTAPKELSLEEATVKEVLREHGFVNADVAVREDLDVDRLIDGVMDNRVYLPSVVAMNKIDLVDEPFADEAKQVLAEYGVDPDEVIEISAETGAGLDELKARLWDALGLVRVYMDKPGRGVDYEEPLVIREGDTVGDACEKLGGDFREGFRFARVTGPSAKHDEQQVGLDHQLADEDVLRLVTRR